MKLSEDAAKRYANFYYNVKCYYNLYFNEILDNVDREILNYADRGKSKYGLTRHYILDSLKKKLASIGDANFSQAINIYDFRIVSLVDLDKIADRYTQLGFEVLLGTDWIEICWIFHKKEDGL